MCMCVCVYVCVCVCRTRMSCLVMTEMLLDDMLSTCMYVCVCVCVNLKSYFDFEGSKAAGSQGGKSSTSTQLKPGFLGSILSSFKSDPSRLCIPLFVTVHKLAFAHFMFTIDTCVIITLTLIC